MPSPNNISFQVVDAANSPVTGLALSFSAYLNQNGAAISSPGISEIGNGFYTFFPVFGFLTTAICYSIKTNNNPGVVFGYVRWEDFNNIIGLPSSPRSVVFAVFDSSNNGKTGLSLSFSTYETSTGSSVTVPAITEMGSGFYRFFPVFRSNDTANIYSLSTGNNPLRVNGEIREDDFIYNVAIPVAPASNQVITATSLTQGQLDLGIDFRAINDQTPVDIIVTGEIMLGERIYRRLTTPSGALSVFDPAPGASISLNLFDLVNAKLTPQDCQSIATQIRNVVMADEQVQDASVNIIPGRITKVEIRILTARGPFSLILGVDNVNAAILYNIPVLTS